MLGSRAAFGTAVAVAVLTTALSGCALPSRYSFGVRPDVPVGAPAPEIDAGCKTMHPGTAAEEYRGCLDFNSVVKWSADLEEAYRSRATLNRWAIYVAGTLGLATVAASGGLAAASAAGVGTLALLSISGGFSTGFFAFLNNGELANMYTIAAGEIATARSDARRLVDETLAAKGNVAHAYFSQTAVLRVAVTNARNKLETARTSDAMAAILRAQHERDQLQKEIDKVKTARTAQVLLKGQITAIADPAGVAATQLAIGTPKALVLTVENVNLDGISKDELRVLLGDHKIAVEVSSLPDMTKPTTWKVKFTAPGTPPKPDVKVYSPSLLLGEATMATAPSATLTYN
jgi:hypothetical protein